MLFHITQVHDPADCPYGQGGSRKFHDAAVEGVTVHGVYGAFMEHTIYMVVEADDFNLLNKFLLPGHEVVHDRDRPGQRRPAARVELTGRLRRPPERSPGLEARRWRSSHQR